MADNTVIALVLQNVWCHRSKTSESMLTFGARVGAEFGASCSLGAILLVLVAGELADATVRGRVGGIGSRHTLLVDGSPIELDLNPWNHGLRRVESPDAFRSACERYLDEQLDALRRRGSSRAHFPCYWASPHDF